MPISSIQLAQILSARIVALGAVPVVTDLQADNAENLLWQQLLALLGGDLELSNLFSFSNDLGTSVVVNSVALEDFPIVNPLPVFEANWPVGGILEVCINGILSNEAGVASGHGVGIRLGANAGLLFPFVSVPAGGIVNFSGCMKFINRGGGFMAGIIGGCLCADGLTSVVAPPTPPLPFADLDILAPQVQMDTADPAVSTTLFSMTVRIAGYAASQIVVP